jgi:hypothetical protein
MTPALENAATANTPPEQPTARSCRDQSIHQVFFCLGLFAFTTLQCQTAVEIATAKALKRSLLLKATSGESLIRNLYNIIMTVEMLHKNRATLQMFRECDAISHFLLLALLF